MQTTVETNKMIMIETIDGIIYFVPINYLFMVYLTESKNDLDIINYWIAYTSQYFDGKYELQVSQKEFYRIKEVLYSLTLPTIERKDN